MDDFIPILSPPSEAIYFLHIAKTGGTSVHRFLEHALPAGWLSPIRTWDDLDRFDPSELHRHSAFSAHLMDSLEPYYGAGLDTITLLRDPVERSISHYAHAARDPASPFHALAQRLTLREFCEHPDGRCLIENYQARQLAARLDDPIGFIKTIHPDAVAREGVAGALERWLVEARGDEAILERARARLGSCVAVGVTERLTDSLAVFADRLGLAWNGRTPFENASYNRPQAVDAGTRKVIEDMTRLDAVLHREAATMLDARLAEIEAKSESARKDRRIVALPRRAKTAEWMHAAKLMLAGLIRRSPLELRAFLSRIYVGYRILVDRRSDWRSRLPLLLGLIYLPLPVDLIPASVPIFGWMDNVAAIWIGSMLAVAHVDKAVLKEIRLAAIARFELPPLR